MDTHRCSTVSRPEKAFLATDLILFPNKVLPFANMKGVDRFGGGGGQERERSTISKAESDKSEGIEVLEI